MHGKQVGLCSVCHPFCVLKTQCRTILVLAGTVTTSVPDWPINSACQVNMHAEGIYIFPYIPSDARMQRLIHARPAGIIRQTAHVHTPQHSNESKVPRVSELMCELQITGSWVWGANGRRTAAIPRLC